MTDSECLLVSGFELYAIRPDGAGRAGLSIDGLRYGLMPDWIE